MRLLTSLVPSLAVAGTRAAPAILRVTLPLVLAGLCACLEGEAPLGPRGPRVVKLVPTGPVARTVPIEIDFSEDASPDLLGRPRPVGEVALIHPPLDALATLVGPRRLRIEPSRPFLPATGYRVALREDVLGDGRRLVGQRVFQFRTAAFGLEDVRGWRRDGSSIEIALRFSHPVAIEDAEAAIFLSTPDGTLLSRRIVSQARGPGPEPVARPADPVSRLALRVDAPQETAPDRVELRIDAGLASTAGGAPLGKTVRREVPIEAQAPLVDQVRPVQLGAQWAVAIDLASSVPPSRLVGAVRGAGPSVRMALSSDGPWILGAFSPETTASLQIGPPLLEAPRPWVVELPALEPALRILDSEPLLDIAPGARLEVEHHGVEGLILTARTVSPELVGLVNDRLVPARPLPDPWSGPSLGPLRRKVDPDGRTELDPAPLLEGLAPVLTLLEIRDENRPWLRDVRYVNRRGLELVVKRRSGYLWARVHDLQGAVSGAYVRVLGVGGEVLGRGTTRKDGEVALDWESGTAGLVIAAADRRYAVLPLNGPWAVRGSDRPGVRAVMIPNRVMLAPGQDLTASVLLSDARERPIGADLELRLSRERGGLAARGPLSVAPEGMGSGALSVPADAEPGRYALTLHDRAGQQLARARLEVRRRRARGARVVVEPADAPIAFKVRTKGLGRAEPVVGACYYHREDEFAGLPPPAAAAPRVDPISVDLGDGSERTVRCPEPPPSSRPWSVRLEGYARDARTGEAVRIHAPRPRYAAVTLPDTPPTAGEPLNAKIRVVDADAQPVQGAVTLEIRPLEPRSGAQVRPGSRLAPSTLSVAGEAQTLTLALVDGSAVVPFVPPRGGPWSLRVEDATEKTFWVAGAPGTPRPLELVLHRTRRGVQAALPFPGRLLLTEEDLEVGKFHASLETGVVAQHRIGRGKSAVSGLLLGPDGRWSAARLPPLDESKSKLRVELTVPEVLAPGEAIPAVVSVRGPSWSSVVQVLAVDACAAPEEARLAEWTEGPSPRTPALDTLVSSAFDAPAPLFDTADSAWPKPAPGARPGRAAVTSRWVEMRRSEAKVFLPWPEVSGRIRIIAVLRAAGKIIATSVDRVVGDGLGVDVVVPAALRAGDRLALPVLLENGSPQPLGAQVALEGSGFAAAGPSRPLELSSGDATELRVLAEARPAGALRLSVGESKIVRDVERIVDASPRWRGRGASAQQRSPAILPTPKQLGATRAKLVVGPSVVIRFAAALQALLEAPPIDAEEAAAQVLAASALPELARTLQGRATLRAALARLPAALSDPDPWVRAFAGHAALEAGGAAPVGAARQTLAEVASSPSDPAAAAYARFLLARQGASVQGAPPEGSSRADAVALVAATDVLLGRADRAVLEELPVAPFDGARRGRYGPTLVNALALYALEAVSADIPAASALEAAIIAAARTSRWSHPAEEALALTALAARSARQRQRPYWGRLLMDGESVENFKSSELFVLSLDGRLGQRPEITVAGNGSAEVGLILAGDNESVRSGPLSVRVRRLGVEGEGLDGPVSEGSLMVVQAELRSSADQQERVILDIPIPAGLEVETAPPLAKSRVGGYTMVLDLPPNGRWVGRFEARARHAGVWQVPPAKAQLRHARAEALAPQDELRVDVAASTAR